LGFALLCSTADNKFLLVFGIVIMITILQKKKERFLKFFKIKFVFIFYTIQVKMKRKAMSIVKNKNKIKIASFQ
jgi:hypothetical protein